MKVHAALPRQTPNTLRAVIAPKLCGVGHVAWPSGILPLAFSILFSSVSSIAGFSGHANYCAANASLDTYAEHHTACGLPTLSVQWGAWSIVGMRLHISSTRQTHPFNCVQFIGSVSIGFDMLFKRDLYVGMAAKRLTTIPNEAIALGMLAPAEGLTAFNSFASFHSLKFGVHGVAPQSYWKSLLRDVMPKPSLFTFLYESEQDVKVCPLALVAMWVPDVLVPRVCLYGF